MVTLNMPDLIQWFEENAALLAGLVTAAVALLLVCCMECGHCTRRDKDDLFNRHEV